MDYYYYYYYYYYEQLLLLLLLLFVTLPPKLVPLLPLHFLGTATTPKRVPYIISILAFQQNQCLQSFLHRKNTLVTHTKSV